MASLDPRLPLVADFAPSDIPSYPAAFPFPMSIVNQIAGNPDLLPPNLIAARQVLDHNRRDSYGGQWNPSVQGSVTPTLALQASYVGTRNLKLSSPRNVNLVNPALGRRPRPEFADVNIMENAANISCHGLPLSANQRFSRGLTSDAFYTWAMTTSYYMPDGTITFSLASLQDPSNIADSRGVKDGNLRHRFVGTFSYLVPNGELGGNGYLKALLGGWNAQFITSWRSGLPFNVTAGTLLVQNGRVDGQRPDCGGAVEKALERGGFLDNTLFVFLGDNGFLLGEQGLVDKRVMHEPSIRIPLLAVWPGRIPAGTVRRELALNLDIAPTLLHAAGVQAPATLHGASLLGLFDRTPAPWRKESVCEYLWDWEAPNTPGVLGLRTETHSYMEYQGIWDLNELYDLQRDPDQLNNLLAGSEVTTQPGVGGSGSRILVFGS